MTPTCGARSRLDSARLQFGAEAGRAAALPGMAEVAPPRNMTKTPNPAPMAMCNSARSTVEWVGRPTPLPSRAASRLRLESALALKPAEWGGAPPLLSRRAARAPLRAARYATSQPQRTTNQRHHASPKRPLVTTTLWSRSVGWDMPPLALAPPRSRSRSRSLAVAYGGGGRCGGGAWRNSLAPRRRRRRVRRSARRVTRPWTGPVPPRAPRAAPRSHRGGGRRSASARARRPRRLLPRTARDAGRPLAGIASSCPRRPPPLGLEVARATVAAPPTGRRMRALDDGRDDSRSLMMMI